MRKFVIVVVLLVLAVKYGLGYLFSDHFQAYADKSKAPWTCYWDNFLGQMCLVGSRYDKAKEYFSHTAARCPDSSMAEEAEYGIAESLEKAGYVHQAARAYEAYAEKYKTSHRAKTARRAAQLIGTQ